MLCFSQYQKKLITIFKIYACDYIAAGGTKKGSIFSDRHCLSLGSIALVT